MAVQKIQNIKRFEWNSVMEGFSVHWSRIWTQNSEIQNGGPKYKKLFDLDETRDLGIFETAD